MLRLSGVTRELGEHHAEHGKPDGCDRCELWDIYTRGPIRRLDSFIATLETYGSPLLEEARAIRSEWGEGDWTNP